MDNQREEIINNGLDRFGYKVTYDIEKARSWTCLGCIYNFLKENNNNAGN